VMIIPAVTSDLTSNILLFIIFTRNFRNNFMTIKRNA
jgi:hypothetical protein